MTVNGGWTIFGIGSWKIKRVSLQPWLIIEQSPAFLGKTWLWQRRDNVLNISLNRASTTYGLASRTMQGLCGDTTLSSNIWPPCYAKMVGTTMLLCHINERQWSVNDFWPCILENARVLRRHWLIIELSATFLSNNAYNMIVTISQNEHQRRVNDLWSCIWDNQMAMECR
jgi:hypothetical protein